MIPLLTRYTELSTSLASYCSKDGAGNLIDCGKPVKSEERCPTHYQQWWRLQPKCRYQRGLYRQCNRIQARVHGYCREHEGYALRTRRKVAQEKTLARFRDCVTPDWETGCWMWNEGTNEDGYGVLWVGQLRWYAHRFSYAWFMGGHLPRRVLDHICNRKLCVRPEHLWPITNTLNNKLRRDRAFAGLLEWWKDAHGIPDKLSTAVWARNNGLPYGWTPPFGREGDQFDEVARLKLPPAESRLQHRKLL